jgi:hypothetical protein
MNLQELHERTGIELRKLRYCLDHDLIPGLHVKSTPDEVGQPRKFADDVGFGIVCAAELLKLGLPHETIRGFLAGMLSIKLGGKGPKKPVLVAVLERPTPAMAYLGDALNVRIVVKEYSYDSGWFTPGNRARLAPDYEPIVIVTLDIGRIRDLVYARR